jgi:dipeptidyl-peptidase-4
MLPWKNGNFNKYKWSCGYADDRYTFDASEKWFWLPVIQINFPSFFTADYYLYNTATKNWQKPFDFQVQNRLFSWWKRLPTLKENNLYVYDVASKSTTQITTDGIKCRDKWYYGLGLWRRICFCKSIWLGKDSRKLTIVLTKVRFLNSLCLCFTRFVPYNWNI